MLWQYDSQDWQVGVTPDVTSEAVDHEYQLMIDDAKKGMFNTVRLVSSRSHGIFVLNCLLERDYNAIPRVGRLYNDRSDEMVSQTEGEF